MSSTDLEVSFALPAFETELLISAFVTIHQEPERADCPEVEEIELHSFTIYGEDALTDDELSSIIDDLYDSDSPASLALQEAAFTHLRLTAETSARDAAEAHEAILSDFNKGTDRL